MAESYTPLPKPLPSDLNELKGYIDNVTTLRDNQRAILFAAQDIVSKCDADLATLRDEISFIAGIKGRPKLESKFENKEEE